MPNCPGAKLSGAKLSWCQIVLVPNCPLLLSWCQIVCFYYLGAKLSALLSWCQIVRCQIVRCQIVLQSEDLPVQKGWAWREVHRQQIWSPTACASPEHLKMKKKKWKKNISSIKRRKSNLRSRFWKNKDSWSSSSFFATWAWMINSCQGEENVPWFWYLGIYSYFLWQENTVWFRS